MPESALLPLGPVRSPLGRPSAYTPEVGERVCRAIANGLPIRRFRERDDLPDPMTLYRWERLHPDFSERFALARKALAENYAFTGLERLEAVDPDSPFGSARVSKARDTAGHMRYLAGCLDRPTWGDALKLDAQVAVSLTVDLAGLLPTAAPQATPLVVPVLASLTSGPGAIVPSAQVTEQSPGTPG